MNWKWNCEGENSQIISSEIILAWKNGSQGHPFGKFLISKFLQGLTHSAMCNRICSGLNCLMSQGYQLLQPYLLATTNLNFLTEPTDTSVLSWSHNEKFILGLTSISTHHKVLKTKVSQTFNTPLFVFQATNIYHDHYQAFPFYNLINVLSLSIQILFSSSLDEKLRRIEI